MSKKPTLSKITRMHWTFHVPDSLDPIELIFEAKNYDLEVSHKLIETIRHELMNTAFHNASVVVRNIAAHYDIDIALAHDGVDQKRLYNEIRTEVSFRRIQEEPTAIVYLLELFCSTSNREAIVGDLLEQYQEAVELYGPARAKILLWRRAIGSIASLAWGACKRFAFVAIFFQVVDWFRKLRS